MKKAMGVLLLVMAGAAFSQERSYLEYEIEVFQDGKSALAGSMVVESGAENPAVFDSMVPVHRETRCDPGHTITPLTLERGLSVKVWGSAWGDDRALISLDYTQKAVSVGDWEKYVGCQAQGIGWEKSWSNPKAFLKLNERVQMLGSETYGQGVVRSFQVFVTLKGVYKQPAVPLKTGFTPK